MNILFVCKHNVFRSKIAEAYFNKVNKNKNITASSAGIINVSDSYISKERTVNLEREMARKLGIDVKGDSKSLSLELLREQDKIIIVADDVPPEIFNNKDYLKPNLGVIVWNIPDIKGTEKDEVLITKIIQNIMKKIDEFVKELK